MSATAIIDDSERRDPVHRIAVAAHEIRTPLGGILALADLLLDEDLNEAARGHASALKIAAEHLFGVASALLGGGTPPRSSVLHLDGFLARVAPAIAARAAAKGLVFRAARGPGVPRCVVGDEGALRQIIENLADNALRATDEGSVELAIERVSGDADSVTVRMVVRDTGSGLGPAPERLFQAYVQGEGALGAAGLGLSVVARIAEGLQGRLEAENRPSGGAEVGVTVRLGAVRRPPAPAGTRLKVLVADDNAINRRVLAALLEQFGHQLDFVEDGASAVAAAAAGAYDLVLMDAVMPGLDGLTATRAIRAFEPPACDVRVVGVTARAYDDEIRAFLAAGADAVVTKPVSVATLFEAIGGREARRAG